MLHSSAAKENTALREASLGFAVVAGFSVDDVLVALATWLSDCGPAGDGTGADAEVLFCVVGASDVVLSEVFMTSTFGVVGGAIVVVVGVVVVVASVVDAVVDASDDEFVSDPAEAIVLGAEDGGGVVEVVPS